MSPHQVLASIQEAASISKASTEAAVHSLLASSLAHGADTVAEDLDKGSRQGLAADDATKTMAAYMIAKGQFKGFVTEKATSSALPRRGTDHRPSP